ncbi:MAG: NAD-dependent epimerase/dehydratase family protein [Thermacetogeniaceae bacterium]|jgi:UDP-glucose 4-epimerase
MRVLITGGAGFIGSHVADLCLKDGHYTVILDNLSTGTMDNVPAEAVFYQEDICSQALSEILVREKVDIVFHHAAQIDVQTSIKEPQADAKTNIMGTINLLEACKQVGTRKIVYASSAAVYGEPCYLPVDENHPLQPQSGYGVSKQVPEQYLKVYSRLHGLDFTALRYANVYGPRQAVSGEGGVVAIFINALLAGQIPQIFGDGEQTRDFVFVEDVARANLAAIHQGSGQVLNIGTGRATTVNELYSIVKEVCQVNYNPEYRPERFGDVRQSYLDSSRAQSVLNWKPMVSLPQGIKETVEYYQQRM